jgi:ABC-type transport system substrate-binding protein
MRKVSKFPARLAWLSASLLLGACGSGNETALTVVTIGEPSAPFEKGIRLSPPARLVRAATTEGLVGFDDQGQIVPALADRWIVTDDGLSYIIRLRDGAWPDGTRLSAQSIRTELRGVIAALRGTSLGLDLAPVDEIRVMTDRVIEIRLTAPMPNLLQLLAQPELGLARAGRGTGPMRLERHENVALLTAMPPETRGLPKVDDWYEQVRPVRLIALPAETAVADFNSGKADLLLGGRIENFPLARSIGLMRGTIKLDPVMGLLGLAVAETDGFLAAPENREAIAMAIDRDALIAPLGLGGWVATTRIVGPGMADDPGTVGERWAGIGIEERRIQAAVRVGRWRAAQAEAGSSGPVRLRIALPVGPGANQLFAQLQNDLRLIGVEAEQVGPDDDAELRLIDSVARYPRVGWFLNQLSCATRRGLCSSEADRLASEALRTGDPAIRADLLGDAEAELTRANVFIPFGAPIRWSLVRGDAAGFTPNRWNIHPLMPMALPPR